MHGSGVGVARGTFRVHPLGEIPGGDPLALTRGELDPKEPVRFHHDERSRTRDHIGTTLALLHLVSDRFISVLDGFSGWLVARSQETDAARPPDS